jgi:hypothetical protein
MEKITYTITGNLADVVNAIDLARTEGRFLSDEPNVLELKWSVTDMDNAEADISVSPDKPISGDEIAILTAEYPSLFIVESFDKEVQLLVAEGVQEQVV